MVVGLSHQVANARDRVVGTSVQTYQSEGAAAPTGVVECSGQAVASNGGVSILGPELRFHLPRAARRATVSVTDASGTPVMASLWRGDAYLGTFCGRTAHPVRLNGTVGPLTVDLFDAMTPDGPSIVTAGSVTMSYAG